MEQEIHSVVIENRSQLNFWAQFCEKISKIIFSLLLLIVLILICNQYYTVINSFSPPINNNTFNVSVSHTFNISVNNTFNISVNLIPNVFVTHNNTLNVSAIFTSINSTNCSSNKPSSDIWNPI